MTDQNKTKKKAVDRRYIEDSTKNNYRIVGHGKHSALKPCHWQQQRLLTGRDNRNCYKGYFGVESHLCLQNTPALPFCNLGCVFCWRDIEMGTLGSSFPSDVLIDSPKVLADEMIKHSVNLIKVHINLDKSIENLKIMRELLIKILEIKNSTGHFPKLPPSKYASLINKSNNKTTRALVLLKSCTIFENDETDYWLTDAFAARLKSEKDALDIIEEYVTNEADLERVFKEAESPKHAAISLAGEPTLYPFIGELVQEFRKKGMTTFIVTNGTQPDIIQKMWKEGNLPTQLYVTLAAPNEKVYNQVCRPSSETEWKKLNETLGLIKDLPCRTVIRITCVKHLNMDLEYVEEYGQMIKNASPDFLDLKAFTAEANALKLPERFPGNYEIREYAPEFSDLLKFAEAFSEKFGFEILEKVDVSRDILLSVAWPQGKSIKIENIDATK